MSQNAMEGCLTLSDLTKLLGKLTSTIQSILPAKVQIWFLQQIQIQALRINITYVYVITMDQRAKEELLWWITKLKIYNGKSFFVVPPELTKFSEAQKKVWDVFCPRITTRGRWSSVEKALYLNILELDTVRLAILSFIKLSLSFFLICLI